MTEQIRLGDVIMTRKPHPCGGNLWTVVRTGADIKIRCNTCGHVVMLDREKFIRRRKSVVSSGTCNSEILSPSPVPSVTPDP